MTKASFLQYLNGILAVSFLTQAVTGAGIVFGAGWAGAVHFYNSVILVAAAAAHLAANWGWIKTQFGVRRR